ncbi:MAG: S9 family peptidase, partial [Pseudomonadota bacterium]
MNRRDMLQGSVALPALAMLSACSSSGTLMTTTAPASPPAPPTPPVAQKTPFSITQLGHTRVDDYHWMKDDNWQNVMRDPTLIRADIKAHLDAENAYTHAMMAPTLALQDRIYQEMRGRTKEDDSSVPAPDGPWDYYRRYETGAQHPIY